MIGVRGVWRLPARLVLAQVGLGVATATTAFAQVTPLSLRIDDEIVAPGGALQQKLVVTEPRPITTGGGKLSGGRFLGLAVRSASGDGAAVGVIRGETLNLRMLSPTSGLGTALDYPVLTATVQVSPTAPAGSTRTLDLTGAVFTDPGGTPYPFEMKAGTATVSALAPSVIDVVPGSAVVPAGGVIDILGINFPPTLDVRLKGVSLTSVTVVDDRHIRVVPAQAVAMFGQEIELRVPSTNIRSLYYAYQRTVPVADSADALLGAIEPAFPRQFWTAAQVAFPPLGANAVYGVAVQNESAAPSALTLALVSGGATVGFVQTTLPANARGAKSIAELFGGSPCTSGCTLRVGASQPVQILGLAGDRLADAVLPILATGAPPPPPPPPPAVLDLTTTASASSVAIGAPLVVTAHAAPGPSPAVVDAYAVLQLPTGQFQSFTPGGLVPGIVPIRRNLLVAGPSDFTVLSALIPAGTPAGTYQFLTAFSAPGVLSLVSPIRATAVTVLP